MRAAGFATLLILAALTACTASSGERAQPAVTRSASDVLKDSLLRTAVKAALIADVGVSRVSVRVERGVATLEGKVADAKAKDAALAAARGTPGIRNVVDRIRVAGP